MEARSKEPSQEVDQPKKARPLVYEWIGDLVVLAYTGGPTVADLEEPVYEIAKGQPEAREGVFVLEEVSLLGVVVRKLEWSKDRQAEEFAELPIFMPWSSVNSMYRAVLTDEAQEDQKQEE